MTEFGANCAMVIAQFHDSVTAEEMPILRNTEVVAGVSDRLKLPTLLKRPLLVEHSGA